MKKTLITLILLAALFAIPASVSASESSATDGATDGGYVITVNSDSELEDVLDNEPGANGPVTVQLAEGGSFSDPGGLWIPENVTLDLNGHTIGSDIYLNYDGASIMNGTLDEGSISVRGEDPKGTIHNVTIKNSPGKAISVRGEDSCIGDITDNTITGAEDHALRIELGGQAGDITGNTFRNCKAHGISIYYGGHCGAISNNKMTSIGGANPDKGDYGIIVSSQGKDPTYATEITGNTITNVASSAIVVFSGPDGSANRKWQDTGHIKGNIENNTVVKACSDPIPNRRRAAIYVDNHAKVAGDIKGNTVDKPKEDAISVISYSNVRSIINNKVTGSRTAGIAIKAGSTVRKNISGNSITCTKDDGIFVNNKSNVKGSIMKNKITGKFSAGIKVLSPTAKVTIKSNKIKNSAPKSKKTVGISCYGAKKGAVIKGNKISNCTWKISKH